MSKRKTLPPFLNVTPSPNEVYAVRIERGMTQQQAAEVLGKTRETWARWEIGVRTMDPVYWWAWRALVTHSTG